MTGDRQTMPGVTMSFVLMLAPASINLDLDARYSSATAGAAASLTDLNDRAEAASIILTLEEAMTRGEKTVPQMIVEEAISREADAHRVGAGIRLPHNPRIQFDARPGLSGSAQGKLGWAALGEVGFEVANAAKARIAEANGKVSLAKANLALARLDAKMLVLQTYIGTQLSEVRLQQAQDNLALALQIKDVAIERLAAGAGSEIETSSAHIHALRAHVESIEAKTQFEVSQRRLNYLLDFSSDEKILLTTSAMDPQPTPHANALVEFAFRAQPELLITAREVELRAKTEERLRLEAKPKLGTIFGVDAAPASPVFGFLGLSLELPIAQRNQRMRAINRASLHSQRIRYDVGRRRLEHNVQSLAMTYESHRLQFEQLIEQALPSALTHLNLIEQGWKAGRFDVLRVTSALQDIIELRSQILDTLFQVWDTRVTLQRTVGGWPHRD